MMMRRLPERAASASRARFERVLSQSSDPMTIMFDYDTAADLFGHSNVAESFANKGRRGRRQPLEYRRFARAADAIRFAVEEMPPQMLKSAWLEVDEMRFDGEGIRRLYESAAYPLARPASAVMS